MNRNYVGSDSRVDTRTIVALFGLKAWSNPYNLMDVRYYLNPSELQRICLTQTYYKSGNVSGCEYIDKNGETIPIAHARAYSYFNKTYIDKRGRVWSNWTPYHYDGENFAEAVAVGLNRILEKKSGVPARTAAAVIA